MPLLLHLAEVLFLFLSAVALALAVRNPEANIRFFRIATVFALGFGAIYLIKLLALPVTRYPEDGNLRGLYLLLLLVHAALAPIGFAMGGTALVALRRKRMRSYSTWVQRAAPVWILSAGCGLLSAMMLWMALTRQADSPHGLRPPAAESSASSVSSARFR